MVKSLSYLELHVPVLTPSLVRPTMLEFYNTISTFREKDGITNGSEILMQLEIAIASSSIEINTISTFGERYGIQILIQSEIAIASSSNEIVEEEIAQTN